MELSQEEKKKLEDDAFNAAMAGTEDAIAPNQEPEQKQDEEIAEQEEVKNDRIEVAPGYTQEELDALKEKANKADEWKKALDTQSGTYGGRLRAMQQEIEDLKKAKPPEQPKQYTADDLKNLKEQFPELADLFAKDMSGLMPQQQPDNSDAVKQLQEKFEAERQAREAAELDRAVKRLTKAHPDYREIATFQLNQDTGLRTWKDMNFANWLVNQSEDVVNTVLNSNDPDDLSDVISSYKQSIKPKDEVESKSKSLEKKVMPKGVTADRVLSDKDREDAAFKIAMAGG